MSQFTDYCKKYPLAYYDMMFQNKHTHVGGRILDLSGQVYMPRDDVLPCQGCPECVYGKCFSELSEDEKKNLNTKPE